MYTEQKNYDSHAFITSKTKMLDLNAKKTVLKYSYSKGLSCNKNISPDT